MEFLPVKTRVFVPPKDDLYAVCDTYLTDVRERDVVVITSKVIAIHEGRCVPQDGADKDSLVRQEAEYFYHPEGRERPLTIKCNALISGAGIDESNGAGYYVLLPKDPYTSACEFHAYLRARFNLHEVGVIVSDSHSLPFRYGAMSIAIACHGFVPVESHIGRPDLFGRAMKFSKTNLADSLAAAATLVSGECDEAQPIVIGRNIPNLVFSEDDMREQFFVPPEADLFKALFRDFKKPEL